MLSKQNKQDRKDRLGRWVRARLAEKKYGRQLVGVARQIEVIIRGFNPDGTLSSITPVIKALDDYSRLIEPWAKVVASVMLADVSRRNELAWKQHSQAIGRELRHVIRDTPIGEAYRGLLRENVGLITSLPTKAAERVHKQVQEGMIASTRSSDIAKNILATGHVTASRAKLIARTEVSRAAVTLTQVRAQAIGSKGYIWRTVGDADVRPEHKKMEGVYVPWDQPPSFLTEPTLGAYHAGCAPNCRCHPEPVLPEF